MDSDTMIKISEAGAKNAILVNKLTETLDQLIEAKLEQKNLGMYDERHNIVYVKIAELTKRRDAIIEMIRENCKEASSLLHDKSWQDAWLEFLNNQGGNYEN